ncbi:hypothetical protein GALMADRAFT_225838 [Galerina marginata CBS 339.88]|uniref:Uncharacterized protein n=1 Tax=Galerina marginata (strain CBS 339.88) TaxID=685588 RepID=A0A067T1F0_GALM3|nr:hypothetical protein GALMADRAFT_225838 [Galerina marginata CBS 339.88]
MSATTLSPLPGHHLDQSDKEHGTTVLSIAPATGLAYHVGMIDFLLLFIIFIMLCWPWAFFGVLLAHGNIQLSGHFADIVKNNPRNINFCITLIAVISNLIMGSLFSTSILRHSQTWMAPRDKVSFYHLSLISAFRNRHFPWGWEELKYMLARKRWTRPALVLLCISCFTFITSGVTTILTPFPIELQAPLNGTELNFSPNASSACLDWLNAQTMPMPITNTCQWKTYGNQGLNYNTCRDSAMTDILQSGRLNALALSNVSEVITFSGLGAKGGLRVLQPLRGALPIGPDGVRTFDTLNSTLLSNLSTSLRNISESTSFFPSYIYTLHQQGIASNITCTHDTQSPVRVYSADQTAVGTVQFNGTCDGQDSVLPNGTTFTSLSSNNSLTFWACKSRTEASSYSLYLRGLQNYTKPIGNITCTALIKPAIIAVKYDSYLGVFWSHHTNRTSPTTTFPGFIDQAVGALGTLIADAQTQEVNLVAETVTSLADNFFNFQGGDLQTDYLLLYQAMLEGILEYEVAYTRLLYTVNNPPASCNAAVKGWVTYTALGWTVDFAFIGYLLPMTLINLTSLILLLVAMFKSKKGRWQIDPTDPKQLTSATRQPKPESIVKEEHGDMDDLVVFPR